MRSVRTVLSEGFFRRFSEFFAAHLAPLGIDPRVLQRADIEIPGEQYLALWEAAGQQHPAIGIELGSQTEADDFGAMGHAIHCATSVEQALQTLQRFIVVFAQESVIELALDTRPAHVGYRVIAPTVPYRRQDTEFAISSILRQLNLVSGQSIKPLRVDFEHGKPADITPHKRVFQCPLYFNQDANRLYLSQDTLRLPGTHANERLYRALEPYLEREREARSLDDQLLAQITRMVAAALSSGNLSLPQISQQLGLNRRTLQRRLKEQQIEFSSLIEEVRRELALSYMQSSDYSVTEISLLVGYSESSSFTRAFRRWTGQSPQQYRASAQPRR
ncbi:MULTISPECIES: AraC family transcriptional regulator [Pseudomonas]|uniref:AraC family transcriptional regulator n=1 Tax=Pseudomonas TaxID=286 RepID=UPI0004CE9B51|nr:MULTISPECIES: AraC family transcriptional regulator [Pseudomonas]AZC18413.1 Transcriptional regulator, AraC family [Pseudomonas sp. CMR5c]